MVSRFSGEELSPEYFTAFYNAGLVPNATSQWLLSGSDDHLIVIHDVRAGSKTGAGGRGEGAVGMMHGHQSWVLKVAASPDGKLLGSG